MSGVIEQKESSIRFRGIIKHECVVLPSVTNNNNSGAIPLEATFKTISHLDVITKDNVVHQNHPNYVDLLRVILTFVSRDRLFEPYWCSHFW